LPKVLETIEACLADGRYSPLKLNCVVLGGVNDDELPAFAALAASRPLDVRFIEYMPFGGNSWSEAKLVPAAEMRRQLAEAGVALEAVETHAHDTARSYRVGGGGVGRISFISSMTEQFCAGCNRLRVTADGNLKVCLFGQREVSLRDAMRAGAGVDELHALIHAALGRKHARHAGMHEIARQAVRPMTTIGG
jgi:cyclic pyranopterin phosphate synthase